MASPYRRPGWRLVTVGRAAALLAAICSMARAAEVVDAPVTETCADGYTIVENNDRLVRRLTTQALADLTIRRFFDPLPGCPAYKGAAVEVTEACKKVRNCGWLHYMAVHWPAPGGVATHPLR